MVMSNIITVIHLNGSSLTNLSATIYSPNYPRQYPGMSRLLWLTGTKLGYRFVVEITDLDVDPCCGNITLYDGVSRVSPVLAVLPGSKINVYESGYNDLLIEFESKTLVKRRGFSALITIIDDIVHFPRFLVVLNNSGDSLQTVVFEMYLAEHLQVLAYEFGFEADITPMATRPLVLPGE